MEIGYEITVQVVHLAMDTMKDLAAALEANPAKVGVHACSL